MGSTVFEWGLVVLCEIVATEVGACRSSWDRLRLFWLAGCWIHKLLWHVKKCHLYTWREPGNHLFSLGVFMRSFFVQSSWGGEDPFHTQRHQRPSSMLWHVLVVRIRQIEQIVASLHLGPNLHIQVGFMFDMLGRYVLSMAEGWMILVSDVPLRITDIP